MRFASMSRRQRLVILFALTWAIFYGLWLWLDQPSIRAQGIASVVVCVSVLCATYFSRRGGAR